MIDVVIVNDLRNTS